MQKSYVLFDVMWRKNGTSMSYIMGGSDTSDRYFDQKHFAIDQKSLRLPVQSVFLVTLTFIIFVITKSMHEVLESPCEVS